MFVVCCCVLCAVCSCVLCVVVLDVLVVYVVVVLGVLCVVYCVFVVYVECWWCMLVVYAGCVLSVCCVCWYCRCWRCVIRVGGVCSCGLSKGGSLDFAQNWSAIGSAGGLLGRWRGEGGRHRGVEVERRCERTAYCKLQTRNYAGRTLVSFTFSYLCLASKRPGTFGFVVFAYC